MSFRRDSEEIRSWREWIEKHRGSLIESTLLEYVYSDRMTWLRFLEHGGWHQETHWSVTMLSPKHAAVLSDFIISEYGDQDYRYLLQSLVAVRHRSSPRADVKH